MGGNKYVDIKLECDFSELSGHLDKNMAMAFSTYSLDTNNNELTDQCTDVCNSGSATINRLEWMEGIEQDHDEPDPSDTESDSEADADTEEEEEEDEEEKEDNRVL